MLILSVVKVGLYAHIVCGKRFYNLLEVGVLLQDFILIFL